MTLILKLDLDMVKMCLHTKNEVSMSRGSKVIAWTDINTERKTDTQMDTHTQTFTLMCDFDLINDLKPHTKDQQVEINKIIFFLIWPWPWPNDLDTQTGLRYGQDVSPYQKWSFYVKGFKSYSLNRHKHRKKNRHTDGHTHTETDRQTHRHDRNITYPHSRVVKIKHTAHTRLYNFVSAAHIELFDPPLCQQINRYLT